MNKETRCSLRMAVRAHSLFTVVELVDSGKLYFGWVRYEKCCMRMNLKAKGFILKGHSRENFHEEVKHAVYKKKFYDFQNEVCW